MNTDADRKQRTHTPREEERVYAVLAEQRTYVVPDRDARGPGAWVRPAPPRKKVK